LKSWRRIDWRVLPLIALIIAGASTSYGYHRILLAQRDWIEHTYQVMSALETTLQLITDAETGQRGYILTNNKTYLQPYRQAIVAIHAEAAKLPKLVQDSPIQLARANALETAINDKLSELSGTIELLEKQGIEQARASVLSDVGRERMDRIRVLIAQMRQAEGELLIARTDRATRTEHAMLAVTIGLSLLSIAARVGLSLVRSPGG
jgi:CHASE3 domain sensor protein